MMGALTFTLTAPVWVPFLGLVVAMLAEAFGSRRAAVTASWVFIGLGAVAALLGANMPKVVILGGAAVAGGGVSLLAAVMLSCATVAVVAGVPAMSVTPEGTRTAALIAGAAAAAVAAIAARDLLLLAVSLEMLALAGYAMVALGRSHKAPVAATTYFVQGAIAAGLLMFGIGALVVLLHGTRFGFESGALVAWIRSVLRNGDLPALTAAGLLATALVFKAGGFPLHSWVPDAYESADAPAAAFLAAVPKTAAVVVLAVVVASLGFSAPGSVVPKMAAMVATLSVVYGTFAGLRQTDYRRMLGYSSIAQAGFALMGLVIGGAAAIPVVALMVAVYAMATVGAFTAAEAWRLARSDWDGSIAGMRGLGESRPLLGVALATVLFSLTGMPPLAGFWGKLTVFTAAIGTGTYMWLAVVGALASVVSFGYYGKVLKAVWFDDAAGEDRPGEAAPDEAWPTAAVLASAMAVLVLGLLPLVYGGAVLTLFGR